MVVIYEVKEYQEFIGLIEELQCEDLGSSVYIYFTASRANDGQSWCAKCNEAWSVIQKSLEKLNSDAKFIVAEVGDVKAWEDKANPFKKNSRYKVKVLPTLLHWRTYKKLEGVYCAKADIVELLFDETEAAAYHRSSQIRYK